MTINEVVSAAAQFSLHQKILLLARLSFELTIAARSTYIPGTEDIAEPRQIRAYNEIQHRVSACVCDLLTGELTTDWLWDYIEGACAAAQCHDEVTSACVRAFTSVHRVAG
jgi:hypothetical protein